MKKKKTRVVVAIINMCVGHPGRALCRNQRLLHCVQQHGGGIMPVHPGPEKITARPSILHLFFDSNGAPDADSAWTPAVINCGSCIDGRVQERFCLIFAL